MDVETLKKLKTLKRKNVTRIKTFVNVE